MTTNALLRSVQERLDQAAHLLQGGQILQAESLCLGILKDWPGQLDATLHLAELALERGDGARAVEWMESAARSRPGDAQIGVNLAAAHLSAEQPARAAAVLEATLAMHPGHFVG